MAPQDLVPIGGVEEVVHVVKPVFLSKGEDGVIGGCKDGKVAGCVFVVVDDRLTDEVVVEQVGVDLLFEQGVIRTVDHDLVNGRLGGGGGSHSVIDDVEDAVVGNEVGGDDVDSVDGEPASVFTNQGVLPV